MLHRTNKLAAVAVALAGLSGALGGCKQHSTAAQIAQAKVLHQQGKLSAARIELKNAVEADPVDADARYALALVYIDTGEALSAEKEIRRAITLGYAPAHTLPVLGKALVMQGEFKKALAETEAAAAGRDPALLCVRADAYLAMNQRGEARQLFASVLEQKPGFPAALIGLGRVAFLEEGAEPARKYADQALAAAPGSTEALMFMGDLLRAQQQSAQALAMYDKALAINPLHRTAHVEKAYLQIATGQFAGAQADLKAAAETTPHSLLVTYTQALLDFSRGKHSDAKEGLQLVLNSAPEHMPSVLLAGAVDYSLDLLPAAEKHLRVYLKAHPENMYGRKMLASALLRTGQSPDALAVLTPAIKTTRDDVQVLALAGESYMQARDFNKAAEFFARASELDPKAANLRTQLGLSKLGKGDSAQALDDLHAATRLDAKSKHAGMSLVRTELALQHFDQAYTAVLALEKEQPDVAAVQDLKGMVYLGKQDAARARASFEKALQLDPAYFPAVANLAQLDVAGKQPAAARQHLTAFLDKNKTSLEAMTALATLASSTGDKQDATHWLEQGAAAYPDAVAPAVRLLTHYLLIGEKQKALSLARKVQVANPSDPDLLDLLGKSQIASGEMVGALETYKKLAAAAPRSAQVHMQVAALHMLLNNTAAAEDQLKTALALQPDFPAAQVAQAELYVRNGQHELAVLMARQLQRTYPKAAAGFQLEGDVLVNQNRPALALPAYERAWANTKTNELLVKTVNGLRLAARHKEAEARMAQWLQQHPKDVRALLFRAEMLMADKQYQPAAQQLEAVLGMEPKNVQALNNQAWTYQQLKDARALPVAEQAVQLAGNQPAVMDTLGWILVEQGDAGRGLAILQKASALAPKARDIRYHVAMGLYKTGNKDGARKELQHLMAGDMQFAQADDVRAMLKRMD
jgi:putative PEP-CTERM system TPR-repeat lipoprotein